MSTGRTLLLLTLSLACAAVAAARERPPGGPSIPLDPSLGAEAELQTLIDDYLDRYLAVHPVSATRLGDHRFDGRWPDPSAEAEFAWAVEVRVFRGKLENARIGVASPDVQVDAEILAHHLESTLFSGDELRPWETNPLAAVGTVGSGLDYLVSRDYAPLDERLTQLEARLLGLPAFLETARGRLDSPARIHTETAIQQNQGLIGFVEGPLRSDFATIPDRQAALDTAADVALAALRAHQAFLEDELLPRSTSDFRLGPEVYERKLAFSLDTDLGSDEVVARAETLLEATTDEMARIAAELHPQLLGAPAPPTPDQTSRAALIRAVLDRLAADHPDDDTLLDEVRATLAEATAFVNERGLVTLPDEPVQIIEMPEFNRGVSIAYCDAPGPFETSRETFYAIAPPPADWPADRRESFYREYNSWMLKDLTIHEAMPGHYLQLAHAGKVQRPLRSVFSSGTFVEGWALYGEWMMGQQGFGGPEVELQRLKMVLRLCINALLDHGVHAGGMSEDQAMALMTERGFQEEGEAAGKWRRACLTSAQLSTYLVGMLEVMDIRHDFEDRAGDKFDLRKFNDLLLSRGSIAPRHIRALMNLPPSNG
jgi:uncharacterized protein (DUF885 family)